MVANPRVSLFHALLLWLLASCFHWRAAAAPSWSPSERFEAKAAALLKELPPIQRHFEGVLQADADHRSREAEDFRRLLDEKVKGAWFAALLSSQPDRVFAVEARFESWKGLMDFLLEHEAVIEVWGYGEGQEHPRRLTAPEVGRLKKQRREQPTFLTVTYRRSATGEVATNRLEFNFKAASELSTVSEGYERHRQTQLAAQAALGARDEQGRLDAGAQWEELARAAEEGRLPLALLPPKPSKPDDLFVALEYEVDRFNNFTNVVRIYRASEIQRRVVQEPDGQNTQVLILNRPGHGPPGEARGFRLRGGSDELEPAPNPVPGQDVIELRVANPNEPDARKRNVLEFGESGIVAQSALARFSLVSAYLEKKRKEIALKKSRLDLIAEPIFAGLNIGGGLAAVGFPIGEAARLGYNAAVVPWFIPDVPSVRQMRELFRLMTAKARHPQLKTKPAHFLDQADFEHLQEFSKTLTDAEVAEHLQHVSDEDLKGMLRLAKMQRKDAQVSNLLSSMGDA